LGKVHIEGEKLLAPAIPPEKYEMPLEQLGLSARTFNSLRRSGITKVGELLEKNDDDLLALRSFGQKSLEEVQERLETLDLKPKAEEEDKKPRRSEKAEGDIEEEEE
jgi:DNA-directed RNA polymerase subunit alpha